MLVLPSDISMPRRLGACKGIREHYLCSPKRTVPASTPVSAMWGFLPFYLHSCVCVCIQHVRMCPQTPVQAAVNHPTRVLGTELGSLGRSRSTLSHLSNPSHRLFENCQRVLNFYPFPRIAGWKLRGTFILKFI